jgi:hypothetical protein
MRWYEWSLKVLGVKLAISARRVRRSAGHGRRAGHAPGVPPSDAIQADLAASEALLAAGRLEEAEKRLQRARTVSIRAARPARGASSCGSAASFHEQTSRPPPRTTTSPQSANVFDLLGERYQAALSHLSMGGLSAEAGSMSAAERYLNLAEGVFKTLGAQRDLERGQRGA